MRDLADVLVGGGRARAAGEARRDTEKFERSRPFEWLVRTGFIARAITYGVIGGLAFAIALGAGSAGAAPNQQGALALIARTLPGRVAVVVLSGGLLAYALWKLTQAIFGYGPEGGGGRGLFDRVANLGGGVVYLAFLVLAIRVLTGSSGNSSAEQKQTAAGILSWPGGPAIVGILGGLLIAISVYQIYDALKGNFANDSKTRQMGSIERRVFMALGHVGLTSRALVFGVVGYFVMRTAIEFNANDAIGVDGALARLHHQALGPGILGLVAAGLMTFAGFSLMEARYRRL